MQFFWVCPVIGTLEFSKIEKPPPLRGDGIAVCVEKNGIWSTANQPAALLLL